MAATDLQDYSRQAGAALLELPRPRVLIGASLGGLLAMPLAAQADALILINPLPPAPWHQRLPARVWEDVIPWRRHARLYGTRHALGDADDATALFAFRRWRDESGAALGQARAGIEAAKPDCPVLFVLSAQDEDVPPAIGNEIAQAWSAHRLETLAGSHVGPLLGRHAPRIAAQTVAWLNRLPATA